MNRRIKSKMEKSKKKIELFIPVILQLNKIETE